MKSTFSFLALSCLALCNGVSAARMALRKGLPADSSQLQGTVQDQSSILNNVGNTLYYIELALNGSAFWAVLDTGSADLYSTSPIPGAVYQGFNSSVEYAIGAVSGPVEAATLSFAGFEIPNQMFIQGKAVDGAPEYLIGLGPHQGSNIFVDSGNKPAAAPPLERIFLQNVSTPNLITVLLNRINDPDENNDAGFLTIGEVVGTNIVGQPKLEVTVVSSPYTQHWGTLLDVNGIIGPNGQKIPIRSQVPNSPDPSRARVIFDTGYTFPQVPAYVAEAFYANISGAQLVQASQPYYTLPCDQYINATFLFAGVEFPIHPLDMNFEISSGTCVGAFQPTALNLTALGADMILGMAFLRNAYLLINFGDFVEGGTSTADPYIQLLSITNATQAAIDFAEQRAGET